MLRAPDGGLRRLPGAHRPPRRPAGRRHRRAGRPRRHAHLLHHRRQRRLGRGHAQRHVQRADQPQRRGRAGDARDDGCASRRVRRPRLPTTTTRWAGRMPWTRPTSGPSRSPRTGAARATARSSTGRTGSRPRARSARSSRTSSTSPPTVLEAAGLPEPTFVNGVQQKPLEGFSMRYVLRRRRRPPEHHETQYFEMFVQPRHLPQGLDRGHPAQHPVGAVGERRRRRIDDDVWELYAPRRLDAGARPRRRAARTAAPSCSGCSSSRPPSTTCCRSTTAAPSASTPTRPAARRSSRATSQVLFGGMGRLSRELDRRASRTSRTPSPPRSPCPTAAREGVIVAQGGSLRRLEPLRHRRPAGATATTSSASQRYKVGAERAMPPASTRCAWSSPTTAAGSARAAPCALFVDGEQVARAASRRPCRWSSRPTRPPMSGARRPRR